VSGWLLFFLLAVQPGIVDNLPPRVPTPAHEFFDHVQRPRSARQALQAFGSCVAARQAVVAGGVLLQDVNGRQFTSRMSRLIDSNRSCLHGGYRLRMDRLAVAGAMAEHLLRRDRAALNARLARAALRPPPATFSGTDRTMMCVVRSLPDQVATLIAAPVESPAEARAANALEPALAACNAGGIRFTASLTGVRAALATAAYCSVHAAPTTAMTGAGR
jgi:hypothetical protein